MSKRFEHRFKVAIAGCAISKLERRSPYSLGALALDTAARAIADAGLRKDQIDGFTTGALLPAYGAHTNIDGQDIVSATWLSEHLGVNPRWVCGFQGGGQITGSVILAVNAIASGAADYVVVHRALHNPAGRYHEMPMTKAADAAQWIAPYGFWGPPVAIALPYQEYMQRYGATREDMATLLVQIRSNAARIPWAHWANKPITRDDYLNSRILADPICIHDCDIPVDGVAAFVLTSAERAKDLPNKPVYVAGYAQGLPSRFDEYRTLDDMMEFGIGLGQRLWQETGLGPKDIDVPQLYDGFAPLVYLWLECLGYCPVGEAHRFIQSGKIDVDGDFPLLSGGGSLGNGRLHGVPHMLESYLQLAKRAGNRQLKKSSTAIACHSYPNIGGAVVYSDQFL